MTKKTKMSPSYVNRCIPPSSSLLWAPSIADDDDFLFNVETQHDTSILITSHLHHIDTSILIASQHCECSEGKTVVCTLFAPIGKYNESFLINIYVHTHICICIASLVRF